MFLLFSYFPPKISTLLNNCITAAHQKCFREMYQGYSNIFFRISRKLQDNYNAQTSKEAELEQESSSKWNPGRPVNHNKHGGRTLYIGLR